MKIKRLIAIVLTTASLISVPKLSEASSALFNRSGNYVVLVDEFTTGHTILNPSDHRQTVTVSSDIEFVITKLDNNPFHQQKRYKPISNFSKNIHFVLKPGESVVIRFRKQNPSRKVNLSIVFK